MNLPSQAIAGLRRLKGMNLPRERCDLCAAPLATGHRHMVDCSSRRVLCVCDACNMMLGSRPDARFRQVPEKVRSAYEIQITDATWTRFQIPVSFAFLCTAEDEVIAIYPSPAGPVSSRVDQEAWSELVAQHPLLLTLQPYVEGLIVHRLGGARDCLIAPIDECYALVGIVRREWQGFTGSEALTALKERIRLLQERAA